MHWTFPRAFWTANVVELFERAAYYAVFIALTLYLTEVVGFDDIWAAWIAWVFSAGLYFLPPFTGAFADAIGFRRAILLAFKLLTIGYFTLGVFPYKATVLPAIVVLMFGGEVSNCAGEFCFKFVICNFIATFFESRMIDGDFFAECGWHRGLTVSPCEHGEGAMSFCKVA